MESLSRQITSALVLHRNRIEELWQHQLILNVKSLVETIGLDEIKEKTHNMLDCLIEALPNTDQPEHKSIRSIYEMLEGLIFSMASQNISPSEISMFVFSIKDAVFPILNEIFKDDNFAHAVIEINRFIDKLGIKAFESYLKSKEEIIDEQQNAFREIAVPVVKLWDRIIMIPLVGILDSERTQLMMETLLTALENMQSKVAILDISGIPVVDTLVARHLISAASAVRLMGAECIITGIRAKIAQTLVQLGVYLGGFITRTTMADGFRLALDLTGQNIGINKS